MKKFLILVALLFGVQTTFSQVVKEGSIEVLRGEVLVNFEADYSQASIMNLSEKEFALYEEDWNKDKPEIVACFTHAAEDASKGKILLGHAPSANYTLRWVVQHINRKGDTVSKVYVLNAQGEVKAVVVDIRGDGGTFGTKLNLIKDGATDSGEIFGKFLRKQLR